MRPHRNHILNNMIPSKIKLLNELCSVFLSDITEETELGIAD